MKNKTGLIIGREYLTRVQKKSFLLTTILVPVVIVAFYALMIWIAVDGGESKERIAVIDEAKLLNPADSTLGLEFVTGESEASFVKKYKAAGYEGFLYVPAQNIDSPRGIRMHSSSSMSMSTMSRAEKKVNKALEAKRLEKSGITEEQYKKINADADIENIIDSEKGEKKNIAGLAYGVSFACGILIYMMMIIYGTQVMRGVMEEKTNRIAEVIVSSVKPFQLMTGKIIGIGLVGLTQFAIWIVLIGGLSSVLPLLFGMDASVADAAMAANGQTAGTASLITEGLASLPLLKIGLWFLFYFLAGYLTYASLFAAVGSLSSDDQQDTQQLMFPILMPIILGFVIMSQAVSNPNSALAVFGSIFPLTSPVVMMGRISYEVPAWQLISSAMLLIGCFFLLSWLTARIYRAGILMYGKKPTWKDMFKYAFRKS